MRSESTRTRWRRKRSRRMKICSPSLSPPRQCLWPSCSSATKSTIATAPIIRSSASTGASWASRGTKATERSSGERRSKTAGQCRADGFGPLALPLLYSTSSKFTIHNLNKRNVRSRARSSHNDAINSNNLILWHRESSPVAHKPTKENYSFMGKAFPVLAQKASCSERLYLRCLHPLSLIYKANYMRMSTLITLNEASRPSLILIAEFSSTSKHSLRLCQVTGTYVLPLTVVCCIVNLTRLGSQFRNAAR